MPLYVITDIANAKTQFGIKAASAALVAKLMGAGIQLETTTPESEPQPQPEGY